MCSDWVGREKVGGVKWVNTTMMHAAIVYDWNGVDGFHISAYMPTQGRSQVD